MEGEAESERARMITITRTKIIKMEDEDKR
jgi:hypothetical protein